MRFHGGWEVEVVEYDSLYIAIRTIENIFLIPLQNSDVEGGYDGNHGACIQNWCVQGP